MPRPQYPKHAGPPPPALPPALQTVGQLVAETLKLYGSRFLLALPLGIPLAVADQIAIEHGRWGRVAVIAVASPAFTAAYIAACVLAHRRWPGWGQALSAFVLGTVLFLPAAFFFPWFALLSVGWLAFAGHAVPAMIVEGRGPIAALRRTRELAGADFVHAIGGLATLVILVGLTRIVMGQLLRSQADNTLRVAVGLSDVVLGPILFLGGALLYTNLVARIGTSREERKNERASAAAGIRSRSPRD